MPTIKTKKEMNLSQLIEWATSNNITNTFAELKNQYPIRQGIRIHNDGRLCLIEMDYLSKNDTFTVEIEEPITKDAKLFLISRCIGEFGNVIYLYDRTTINSRLKNLPKDCKITHLYIENEDNELQLIWTKEKGLVD